MATRSLERCALTPPDHRSYYQYTISRKRIVRVTIPYGCPIRAIAGHTASYGRPPWPTSG